LLHVFPLHSEIVYLAGVCSNGEGLSPVLACNVLLDACLMAIVAEFDCWLLVFVEQTDVEDIP
jgi:hypothetical protein